MFLFFTIVSFLGAWFVENNATLVQIRFLKYETPPIKQGLIILGTLTLGMFIAGLFSCIELLALYIQNRRLKRKLATFLMQPTHPPANNVTPLVPRGERRQEPIVSNHST